MIELAPKILSRIVRKKLSKVNFLVTYDCNKKCKTCDIWKINKEDKTLRDKKLKLEEIKEFFSNNSDVMWFALNGGEPFMRNDIEGIILSASQYANVVNITTNGSFPTKVESTIKSVLSTQRKFSLMCNISLNGLRETHDYMAGVDGSYEKAMETFARLKKINDELVREYGTANL